MHTESDAGLKSAYRGSFFIIVAGICWGLIGLFTRKLSFLGLDSLQITFFRNLVAALEMALVICLIDKNLFRIAIKDLWIFLGTGILSIAFFNACYFKALELTTMAVASILLYTAPCMVMVMSCLFFKEKITRRKLLALVLAFVGCVFTTGILGGNGGLSAMSVTPLAILIGLGSGFGYALYSIFGTVALRRYDTVTITFYTFLFAAVSMAFLSKPLELVEVSQEKPELWLCGILLSTVSTVVPFLCYTTGLKTVVAGKASVMAFIEPMVATLVGIFVFHEEMTVMLLVGIGLIFVSVVLLNIRGTR